ncbi:hypothetical protein BP6252_02418 [Coleophoma cylindrospora]|uniref:Endoglucanase EG-II n=1 Tax=Coleophoma cylindrospora TaxID=1849047 RepID=A0A3D8SGE4_9HELO|nr:hypothetical protein BP6252_02418 [Coleophoma cylindrospora]
MLPFWITLAGAGLASAATKFAGVNIAGFDFGADTTGTANLASALPPLTALNGPDGGGQMAHFATNDGLNMFRLPVTWQYLINNNSTVTDTSTLDATNFGKYDMLMQSCLSTGANCILNVHNYARFNNKVIGQGGPTDAAFANLWSQLATKYANNTKVIFGVMNEPHDLPNLSTWTKTVQAAVTAIRKTGATNHMILLPGTDFSGAQTFISNGSAGNLSTVVNLDNSTTNLIFDVHKYLDSDGSGTHTDCVSNHVTDTFTPLAAFLKTAQRTAMLSETGGGNTTSCLTDLCQTLTFINANSDVFMGYAGWAAGGFDQTYALAETPIKAANGNYTDVPIVTQCIVGTRKNSTA